MNEQERKAFEAALFSMYEFFSDRPHFERYTDGDYIDTRTHKFWRIWQARAALAANTAADDLERAHNAGFVEASRIHGREIESLRDKLAANVPAGFVLVNAGALQMVRNALKRDADEGRTARGEMLAELDAVTKPAPAPEADAWRNRWPSTAAVHPDAPAPEAECGNTPYDEGPFTIAEAAPAPEAAVPPARCPCGYPQPCSKTVPVGFCRSHVQENQQ